MKNTTFITLTLVFSFSLIIASCDSGFDAINTDDTAINDLDPILMLNHAIYRSSPDHFRHTMIYEMAIVQHMVTPFGTSLAGGNFNQINFGVAERTWNNQYENVIKNTEAIISKYKDNADHSNVYNMARIIRAYGGMILTDTYGDIPFSEAGMGFLEGVDTPVYDSQESIYNDILSELEEATAALSSNSKIKSSDVLYAGDIKKWKRFGYSLMLRAAMRLTKVNPSLAHEYVEKARAGGVMESNDDNALVRHSSNFPNYVGGELNGSEAANFYMTKPLVDFLQSNDDPRLDVIAIRYVGATNGTEQTKAVATHNPNDQIGFPIGYDNNTIQPRAEEDGVGSFYSYSQFDRNTIGKQDAPFFMVTYAQTQLLLAEAVERGWVTGKSAVTYFTNGIRAHVHQLEAVDSKLDISDRDIDAYVQQQKNAYLSGGEREHINNQYWIASLFNAQEAFANFRRSGYPNLEPNPYPQSGIEGDFIRRLIYPRSEYDNNTENINAAVSRQGPDELDTRIWWDQEAQ